MADIGNWVIEHCNTAGSGNLILTGSEVGFTRFRDAVPAGDVWYSIEDGNNREAGFGQFNGTNTIIRSRVDY